MESSKIHGLPPLKRFRLMQQQEEEEEENTKHECLPAKKRKDSRNPSPLPPNPATITFCLPAKKRVFAIQPFDLNHEYEPPVEFEKPVPEQNLRDTEKVISTHVKMDDVKGVISTIIKTDENVCSRKGNDDNNNVDDDDGIVCAICESTDGDPTDPIVLCDGCDLMVHTTCYGHPLVKGVPEGDWFCAQCLASQPPKTNKVVNVKAFSCCLCPVLDGALKPTNDGKWAHVVCALFVPEVFFSDPEGRQGIDCSKVPRKRWEQRCYVCKKTKNGCVIDCSEPNCGLAFHVTCGLKQDLCIEYQQGKKNGVVAGFCRKHTDLWEKQQKTGKFKIVARDGL